MSKAEFSEELKCFVIRGASLDGKRGLKARFSRSANTSKGDV